MLIRGESIPGPVLKDNGMFLMVLIFVMLGIALGFVIGGIFDGYLADKREMQMRQDWDHEKVRIHDQAYLDGLTDGAKDATLHALAAPRICTLEEFILGRKSKTIPK